MFKPVFGLKFLQFLAGVLCLFFTFSCVDNNADKFEGQRRQLRNNNPINITQEDPINYYYQEPAVRSGGYQRQYGRPVAVQPYYYPSAAPAYMPGGYQVPASRFYSNPYAIPPSNQGYQRYDADQYYVPPSGYRNIERQQSPSNHHDVGADVKG